MARKTIMKRGNSIIGIYPEDFERGHVPGRRGIRRVLCSVNSVAHLPDNEKANYLNNLYFAKEHEIRTIQLNEKLTKDKKQKSRKLESIKEASAKWLKEIKTLKDNNTHNEYKHSIEIYIALVGNHRVVDFDRESNVTFLAGLADYTSDRTGKLISANTQHKHLRHLKSFLNWCHLNEYFPTPKKLIMPQTPEQEMETFTLDEMELILTFAKHGCMGPHKDKRQARFINNIYRAAMMAKYTLLRSGAIWSLPIDNIDIENQIIRIRDVLELNWHPKKLKWPNKPIHKTLLKFLISDLENRNPSEKYFLDNGKGKPWHSGNDGLSKAMRKVCNKLDLPKQIKPFHWGFRATQITWLLDNGAPPQHVQMLADHSSLSTTLGYRNTKRANQRLAVDLLPD